jgi:hypothetical protein
MEESMDNHKNYRKKLNVIASDYFRKLGVQVQTKMPYILKDRRNWDKNLLSKNIYDCINKQFEIAQKNGEPFPIHKYIHHGLSSQALLFNLFGEFIITKNYDVFNKIFFDGENIIDNNSKIQFEYSDRNIFNELQQQPTSFDMVIDCKYPVFIESKFTEQKYGTCSIFDEGDCDGLNPLKENNLCYLHKTKKRKYLELMSKYKLDAPYLDDKICPLTIYYQFYRELIFALKKNGIYYLLYDNRNPVFFNGNRGVFNILYKRLPNEVKPFVKALSYQNIIKIIEPFNIIWINDFKEKYGM